MKYSVTIPIILLLIFLFAACDKNPSGSEETPCLSGIVRDEDGRSLSGAGVHFIFVDWRNLGKNIDRIEIAEKEPVMVPMQYRLYQNYPNPFNPSTCIQFNLAERSHVTFIVYQYPGYAPVDTLVSEVMAAGCYMILWSGRNAQEQSVSNGFYPYRLTAGGFTDEKTMCIQMLDTESLAGSKPKFCTDSQGRFEIPYDHIPVGKEIPWMSETADSLGTFVVSDSVTIVLTKSGYASVEEKIKVNVHVSARHSFIMPRE
ncbi:hypothetical protein JW835_00095 [bacterium]|nr:hypothetical protein [bacterium]